jgi:hypothetical protein
VVEVEVGVGVVVLEVEVEVVMVGLKECSLVGRARFMWGWSLAELGLVASRKVNRGSRAV